MKIAIIGAGSIGIAVAHFLVRLRGVKGVTLVDPRDPMSLTSAQSGENYRNWWPHPVMTAFTDHSTTLMEELDRESGGRLREFPGTASGFSRLAAKASVIDWPYTSGGVWCARTSSSTTTWFARP